VAAAAAVASAGLYPSSLPSMPMVATGHGAGGNMQDALTNLLGWISEVLGTLQKIKWLPLGIERQADSTERTHYQMMNPNADIERVLATYKNEVMSDLHLILGSLEPMIQQSGSPTEGISNTTGPASGGGSGMERAGSVEDEDELPPIMPSLVQRQQSSAYIGDTANSESVPYVNNYTGPVSVQESGVHYIIGKMLVTQDLKFGFPAFNKGMQLLGFYKEADQADTEVTSLSFIPLSHAKASASLTKENLHAAADSLEKEIKRKSESVFKRGDFSSLRDMKESAWLRYMGKVTANSAEEPWELGEDFLEL